MKTGKHYIVEIKESASGSDGIEVKNSENVNFGDKDFSITMNLPNLPLKFYINKRFKCPVCSYEAEHNTNADGEPENKPFCPMCFKMAAIPIMELVTKGES